MTLFPVFYAVIENDLRRVLAYSLNNQLGFMVVGIGIGTALSLNGTVSHAFAHILYKALLFMTMGAVLYRTGTIKATELGGLYKSMPVTTVCCIVGAASISGFPFFTGFVTKSMVISAVEHHHLPGSSSVCCSPRPVSWTTRGSRSPSSPSSPTTRDPRSRKRRGTCWSRWWPVRVLCVCIGVFPAPLYEILPFPVGTTSPTRRATS